MSAVTHNWPAKAYRVFRMAQYGRPVLATPVSPLALRLAGLMRFQPTTRRKAVYRRIMWFLMQRGIDHWFAQDVESPLEPASGIDFPAWLAQARLDVGDPAATASVIWPNEPHRQRVYVHLFDSRATPIGFAKLSLSDENDRRLALEAATLERLRAMGLKECHVPRVLGNRDLGGRRSLILEPVPEEAQPLPNVLDAYPASCVEELDGPARFVPEDKVKTLSWWGRYQSRLEPVHASFSAELDDLVREGMNVRRAHGDFGRHNIVSVGGKPWVFDWEEACEDAPAPTDEVVFWVTFHYRAVLANPRLFARLFAQRFLHGADRRQRCGVMAVIAFRHALGMTSAGALMKNWDQTVGVGVR